MPPLTKIILIGMKSSGKTSAGRMLARRLGLPFTDMDAAIEQYHKEQKHENLRFREIFQKYGKEYFRGLETGALRALSTSLQHVSFVLATGGGLPLAEENRRLLKQMGTVVFLNACSEVLLARIRAGGIPAFFPYPDDPERSLAELLAVRQPIYQDTADITVECLGESPSAIAAKIIDRLENYHRED